MSDRLFPSIRGRQRNQLVDVLRGMSILMVIFSHLPALDRFWAGSRLTIGGRGISEILEDMGYYGVNLFFVISGFLITSVTLRRYLTLDKINCSAFWWMRFSRIMPMLLTCLVAMVGYHFIPIYRFRFADNASLWKDVTAALSFHSDQMMGTQAGQTAWNPMWSLSVEEIFYLAFPFVCLAINGIAAAVWVFVPVIAAAVYFRLTDQVTPYAPLACMDLLALGCLVAVCRPARLREALSPRAATAVGTACGLAGLAIIACTALGWPPVMGGAWPSLGCGVGAALALLSTQLLGVPPSVRPILMPVSALGVISYELYLIHLPLAVMMVPVLAQDSWLLVILAICLAALAHECFSEPMNRTLRELGSGASAGSGPVRRTRRQNTLRCAVLSAAPLAAIGLSGAFAAHYDHPALARFRIVSVARMPDGSSEPLVYTGRKGAGDLLYLRHEAGGMLRVGVDHWGSGGPLSAPFSPRALTGGLFNVRFRGDGVTVNYDGKTLLRTTQGFYSSAHVAPVGVNDIGFSSALPAASSTIVDCR